MHFVPARHNSLTKERINEETPWHILPVVTMLVCTVWLTFQLDPARQDRNLLFKDLVEQCRKIQADMSGLWETLPSGQLQRQLRIKPTRVSENNSSMLRGVTNPCGSFCSRSGPVSTSFNQPPDPIGAPFQQLSRTICNGSSRFFH